MKKLTIGEIEEMTVQGLEKRMTTEEAERMHKLGFAELLNKMYEYKISKTDKEKMLKILLKIIQNNYYCKFNEIIIKDNEFLLEIHFSNLTINVGFNLEHLLRTEFNKNYIIYNIDNVILNYYKIEK